MVGGEARSRPAPKRMRAMQKRPRLPTLMEMDARAAALPEGAEKDALVRRVRALREGLAHLPASVRKPALSE